MIYVKHLNLIPTQAQTGKLQKGPAIVVLQLIKRWHQAQVCQLPRHFEGQAATMN